MNIIQKVKELNFPQGKYVVIGSGILDVLGMRTAHDIDISVLPELYEQLLTSKTWEEEDRYGKIFLKKDNIEINPKLSWSGYSTSTQEAIKSATIVDGVPFMNLRELRKFKQALGREKDFADIALIEAYLESPSIDEVHQIVYSRF